MGPTAGWGWPVPAIHMYTRYRMTQVDTCSNLSLFSLASSKGYKGIYTSHTYEDTREQHLKPTPDTTHG